MKTAVLLVVASALFASSMLMADVQAQSAPSTSVPPPPGLNDPGVKAVAPPARPAPKHAATPHAGRSLDLKPQALPARQDNGSAYADRDPTLPEIKVHQEGDNQIQEYSRNGRVYMVVVTPKSGIAQTYMVDPEGRLVDEHGMKPARPVMYKVLEWGKSRPATDASEAPQDSGNP